MIKILLAMLALLLLITFTTLWKTEGSRQAELLQDLDWCTVAKVTQYNSFVSTRMECNYFDGVIIGKIRETLYVSKKGFVIKAWR